MLTKKKLFVKGYFLLLIPKRSTAHNDGVPYLLLYKDELLIDLIHELSVEIETIN